MPSTAWRSIGTALPLAALAQPASRNSWLVSVRSWARVRTRSGSQATSSAPSGSTSRRVSIPSTSAGASDSIPSTAMPWLSFSSRSAAPGSTSASAAARSRTASVRSSSRHGGAHEPVGGDLERALVGDLEPADLLDGVAPELQPQRVLLGGREDVEDAATHGELAAALDEVGAGVGGRREVLDDPLEGGLVAGLERDRAQVAQTGDDGLEDRPHRRDDDRERAVGLVALVGVGQPAQHRQALADGVAAGAQPLVREGLPRGEQPDDAGAEGRLEGRLEVLGLATGGGDGQHRGTGRARGQRCHDGGPGARRGRRDDLRGRAPRGPPGGARCRGGRRHGSAGRTGRASATA